MISPYAIKLATKSLDKLGNISGNLYSVSTIGSIVGTFLTVFVLIPLTEIDHVFYGLGILLIVSSLIGLRLIPKTLAFFLLIVLSFSLVFNDRQIVSLDFQNFHLHPGHLVYETETLYSHLDVIDNYNSIYNRALFLNGFPHSIMDKLDPYSLESDYTKFFPLGLLLNDNTTKVLFIGGGGFSGPKYFMQHYPNITVDVVEIDPQVVEVAKKYFFLDESNPLTEYYYAYGIRNSFGMDIDPLTGKLWNTENGEDNYDEINLVQLGFNSGWSKIMGPISRNNNTSVSDLVVLNGSHYSDPEFSWRQPVGVTDIEFLESSLLGNDLENNIFVGDINNGILYFLKIDSNRSGIDINNSVLDSKNEKGLQDLVVDDKDELEKVIFAKGFDGRITDIETGLDGNLYILTYFDGSIYRITHTEK